MDMVTKGRNMKNQTKNREGAAAIYIVIFTTMLFSIIALSFVRIMVSEANQTVNYSLSQSAYNSAQAGIEDAKIALLKYQNCISTGDAIGKTECQRIRAALTNGSSDTANDDCDTVKKALNRTGQEGETMISSTTSHNSQVEAASQAIDQAYTCVMIKVDTEDYISKLNNNSYSKFVPLRSERIQDLGSIKILWFSQDDARKVSNGAGFGAYTGLSNTANVSTHITTDAGIAAFTTGSFSGTKQSVPPVLRVDLIQTSKEFGISEFYSAKASNRTNRGTLTLRPSSNSSATNNIGATDTVGFAASAMKGYNAPMDIKCDDPSSGTFSANGYACSTKIAIPSPNRTYGSDTRNEGNTLLRVTLPYGGPETTFQVVMYDKSGKVMDFSGVQSIVDSTGRANDLFRRVEARLEMIDTYFPMPDAALTLSGDGNTLNKNFYVTNNCFSQTVDSYDPATNTFKVTRKTSSGSAENGTKCYNYHEL